MGRSMRTANNRSEMPKPPAGGMPYSSVRESLRRAAGLPCPPPREVSSALRNAPAGPVDHSVLKSLSQARSRPQRSGTVQRRRDSRFALRQRLDHNRRIHQKTWLDQFRSHRFFIDKVDQATTPEILFRPQVQLLRAIEKLFAIRRDRVQPLIFFFEHRDIINLFPFFRPVDLFPVTHSLHATAGFLDHLFIYLFGQAPSRRYSRDTPNRTRPRVILQMFSVDAFVSENTPDLEHLIEPADQ